MSKHDRVEPGKAVFPGKEGLTVKVDRMNFDKALRIFKKKIMNDGILKELKRHQAYEKPSEKRRREKAEARRRHLKALHLKKKFSN